MDRCTIQTQVSTVRGVARTLMRMNPGELVRLGLIRSEDDHATLIENLFVSAKTLSERDVVDSGAYLVDGGVVRRQVQELPPQVF